MPNETKFWDTEELVGEILTGGRSDKIVVKHVTKNGKEYLDVRTWYPAQTKPGEEVVWLPSKGIAIPKDSVDAVCTALQPWR